MSDRMCASTFSTMETPAKLRVPQETEFVEEMSGPLCMPGWRGKTIGRLGK